MTYLFDIDGVINKADCFSIQYEKDFGIDKSVFDTFFINEFEKCANGSVYIKTVLPKHFKEWKIGLSVFKDNIFIKSILK